MSLIKDLVSFIYDRIFVQAFEWVISHSIVTMIILALLILWAGMPTRVEK